ncbi:hypothetical protein A6E15_12380 [Natrinema saccharevitans]|uniref:Cox cluster protein n=1 Tax=Natrinema saccharevitans TaxID=301967 RepID=A0A1S8AYW5_9EURY|nr:hypothetical protein [Natrinema saccharevitans]OLZ41731.1 hypothetical protein A6E15_12380 [Natrinema saccharevitans]
MSWLGPAIAGLCGLGVGAFVSVLVANLEPQPEYPTLLTDLVRLLGTAIAVAALGVGLGFFVVAGQAYSW